MLIPRNVRLLSVTPGLPQLPRPRRRQRVLGMFGPRFLLGAGSGPHLQQPPRRAEATSLSPPRPTKMASAAAGSRRCYRGTTRCRCSCAPLHRPVPAEAERETRNSIYSRLAHHHHQQQQQRAHKLYVASLGRKRPRLGALFGSR